TILRVGRYQSPEGEVVVTPDRIRHWANEHAEMRRAGILTPVPWGHHLQSVPQYPGETQYLAAKMNAGYFPELRVSPDGNELIAVVECPGVECDRDGNLTHWVKIDDG